MNSRIGVSWTNVVLPTVAGVREGTMSSRNGKNEHQRRRWQKIMVKRQGPHPERPCKSSIKESGLLVEDHSEPSRGSEPE